MHLGFKQRSRTTAAKDLGNGLAIDITLAVHRSLKQQVNKQDPSQAQEHSDAPATKAALECLLSGSFWPTSRVSSIKPGISATCPRCNEAEDTALHQFWTCPCNAHIEDPRVSSTQDLVPVAEQNAEATPCLWLRGLLPSSNISIPSCHLPSNRFQPVFKGSWSESTRLTSGVYYTDASGGEDGDSPVLRRCGVAICASPSVSEPEAPGGICYPLPGEVQTVPRGELHAIYTLVRLG